MMKKERTRFSGQGLLLPALALLALLLVMPLGASAWDADWDSSGDTTASALTGPSGGVITITGDGPAGGAMLTVDVEGVTVTSGGVPRGNVGIVVDSGVTALAIRDLDLTAAEEQTGIDFAGGGTLAAAGGCTVTGGERSSGSVRCDGIFSAGGLTVEVGDGTLTVTGGAYTGSLSSYAGGHGIFSAGALDISVGTGALTARGSASGGNRGGYGLYGASVTVDNAGGTVAARGGTGAIGFGTGIYSDGDVTLTGPGRTAAEGNMGIAVRGTLTVNGPVEAKGEQRGINFYGSSNQLAGSGALTVTGIGSGGTDAGIYAQVPLELAFTGSLDVRSASHGIYFPGGDSLTLTDTPAALYIQPGGGGYAIGNCGGLVNNSAIPDSVLVFDDPSSIRWPLATPTPVPTSAPTPPPVPAYTVTFRSGDETLFTRTVTRGALLPEPAEPQREGYAFTGWYTDPGCTKPYVFTRPVTDGLTLYAGWEEIAPEPEENAPYIRGYPDGTFRPGSGVTRAEAAVMLYNLAGGETLTAGTAGTSASFPDVKAGVWYAEAVEYLAEAGVISGYPDGSFRPGEKITRAAFTAMLAEYRGLSAAGESGFSDVPADHWAAGAIAAARRAGLAAGYPDGSFRPGNGMTRTEAVTMLNRMLGRSADQTLFDGLAMPFSDVPPGHWGYWQIIAAAVEHKP